MLDVLVSPSIGDECALAWRGNECSFVVMASVARWVFYIHSTKIPCMLGLAIPANIVSPNGRVERCAEIQHKAIYMCLLDVLRSGGVRPLQL
jgi:hypothetical protein